MGDDTIHGEDGNDTIRDSRGNEILYDEKGRDILNAVDHVDHIAADTLIGGTGKDILQGDIGDVIMGGRDVAQFEAFLQDDVSEADDCVHILDFEPEKDKLVILFDEPIEQAANPDRVIMTYDSRADATNVYADGKKVAEIFGVYPKELQVFYLGNFSRIALFVPRYSCGGCDKSSYWRNYPTYPLTNCEILLNCKLSYENQYAHSAQSPYQL